MLYNIWATGQVRISKVVEASSQVEAQELASELIPLLDKDNLDLRSYASVSDKNFRYDSGAFYLVKRYSLEVPAKCIRSIRKGSRWEHKFKYLDTGKTFMLRYKEYETKRRVTRLLCEDGKIGDSCDDCPARFFCFTNK